MEYALIVNEDCFAGREPDGDDGSLRNLPDESPESPQDCSLFWVPAYRLQPGRAEEEVAICDLSQHRNSRARRTACDWRTPKSNAPQKLPSWLIERRDNRTAVQEERRAICVVLLQAEPPDDLNLGLIGVERNRTRLRDVGMRSVS